MKQTARVGKRAPSLKVQLQLFSSLIQPPTLFAKEDNGLTY